MGVREYRLTVAGELSDTTASAFEGMEVAREGGRTHLVGPVRDQAELQGMLQLISDLGLTLLVAVAADDEPGA